MNWHNYCKMIKWYYQEKNFKKNNKEIKFLGLWISTDPELYASLKHEKYKKKLKKSQDAGNTAD